jgi:signal transduction histidine kinase
MGDSPLLPLVLASAAMLGLVGLLVFAVMKLRKSSGDGSAPGRDRLSEEAFAAATITAALAGRPAPVPGAVATARPAAAADSADAAVLEALPLGLIVTDEAGVVRRCTGPAREWLGIAGPGTGHPYRAALAAWPAIADGLARAHAGDTLAPFTVLTDAAAAPSPRLTVTITRWTPRGGRGGAMAVLSTAIVSAPADTETTSAQAQAGPAPDASAEASRLASGLAHELANSLTTIHGYAHLVDRQALSEADRSALDHIAGSSEKMLSTIEAFRALVRPLPITAIAFAPVDAVQAAITLARQEAERPDAAVHVASTPSGMVHGDQVLLEEALAAVIRNAIEASQLVSPAPPVEVSVAQVPGATRVSILVTDHGPGVLADIRDRIFQPFATDKPGHLGLGLARAAQVVRAHPGATIALEHPAGGGLTVAIGLPQHR